MAANGIIFEAYLRDDGTPQYRRFFIEEIPNQTDYKYLREHFVRLFPSIGTSDFKITWKDDEDEETLVECNRDIEIAFREMVGRVKTFYVTVLPNYRY